jgi:ferredoxin
MAYVVTENCLKCKYTDCVVVCPVDCFHEGKNMLAINPDQCIDCGVCEPECPAEAIQPASEANIKWQEINREMSTIWPNITQSKKPLPDADQRKNETGKFEKYFKENLDSNN